MNNGNRKETRIKKKGHEPSTKYFVGRGLHKNTCQKYFFITSDWFGIGRGGMGFLDLMNRHLNNQR